MELIRRGLEDGLDVSVYAKPEYNWDIMHIIFVYMKNGHDYSLMLDHLSEYDEDVIDAISTLLEEDELPKGINIFKYINPSYDFDQLQQVYLGLLRGLDITKYNDPKFNSDQMYEIRLGLKEGLDVTKYAKSEINDQDMRNIRINMLKSLNLPVPDMDEEDEDDYKNYLYIY